VGAPGSLGSVPAMAGPDDVALIVVDMLNRYEHEDAEPLKASVRAALPTMAELVDVARASEVLTVYVNDNHGDWTAGRRGLIEWAEGGADPSLVEPIAPTGDVPFLVKARHSAFFATQLEYLLRSHDIQRLVLVGQVTEQCILYTALDAYIRHFDVTVPRDAVAHIHDDLADGALRLMEVNMRADVVDVAGAQSLLRGE
jgi:nicotinamidase-related amidase